MPSNGHGPGPTGPVPIDPSRFPRPKRPGRDGNAQHPGLAASIDRLRDALGRASGSIGAAMRGSSSFSSRSFAGVQAQGVVQASDQVAQAISPGIARVRKAWAAGLDGLGDGWRRSVAGLKSGLAGATKGVGEGIGRTFNASMDAAIKRARAARNQPQVQALKGFQGRVNRGAKRARKSLAGLPRAAGKFYARQAKAFRAAQVARARFSASYAKQAAKQKRAGAAASSRKWAARSKAFAGWRNRTGKRFARGLGNARKSFARASRAVGRAYRKRAKQVGRAFAGARRRFGRGAKQFGRGVRRHARGAYRRARSGFRRFGRTLKRTGNFRKAAAAGFRGAGLAGLARAGGTAAAAVGLWVETVNRMKAIAESTNAGNRHLSRFNGAIGTEFMRLDLGDFRRNVDLSRQTQASTVNLARAVNLMRDNWQEVNLFKAEVNNRVGGFAAGFAGAAGGDFGRIAKPLRERMQAADPGGVGSTVLGAGIGSIPGALGVLGWNAMLNPLDPGGAFKAAQKHVADNQQKAADAALAPQLVDNPWGTALHRMVAPGPFLKRPTPKP